MPERDENGHHELMDNSMEEFGGNSRETDYLAGVDEVSGGAQGDEMYPELSVGQRVKQIRESRGLNLQDLSRRTGLDEKALDNIEKGLANPPLGELIKLGKALNMKLGTLIANGEERTYTVMRVAERQAMSRYSNKRETSYGYSYQALAPKKSNRSMEPFMVTLRKGEEEVLPSTHDGEEFIYVMEGRLEVLVGDDREVLEPGDVVYYDSIHPHLLRPADDNDTRILAVMYTQEK